MSNDTTHGATVELTPKARVPAWIDALGWAGSLAVLSAHFLANSAVISDGGALYAGLNAGGSMALVVMCARRGVWPAVWLNTVWGTVAIAKLASLAL